MAVLRPEAIHDLGVRDLEQPTDEFAFGPPAKPSDGLQCGEVNLLQKVLSRGSLANASQEVAKDTSVGGLIELSKGVPIMPARPVEPFDVPRG
jgi:hypothetical protein